MRPPRPRSDVKVARPEPKAFACPNNALTRLVSLLLLCTAAVILLREWGAYDYSSEDRLGSWLTLENRTYHGILTTTSEMAADPCKEKEVPTRGIGSQLPQGVLNLESDLYLRSLSGSPSEDLPSALPRNLLAVAAGAVHKKNVNEMVKKFPRSMFTIMIFHYDNKVDPWDAFDWSAEAIHVTAKGQTKWWFAKRFLHPSVVAPYEYIFIWDEDLGTKFFDARRYVEIVREQHLDVSQPALENSMDDIHHQLTAFSRNLSASPVHRVSTRRTRGRWKCDENSIEPPCAGWVEIMAPVFSRSAWQCFWGLLQNDLVHGWGLDLKSGYCAGVPRHKSVGIVDEQRVSHLQYLTLFGNATRATRTKKPFAMCRAKSQQAGKIDPLCRATLERRTFVRRWRAAARADKCWNDPYPKYKGPDATTGGWKAEKRWQAEDKEAAAAAAPGKSNTSTRADADDDGLEELDS